MYDDQPSLVSAMYVLNFMVVSWNISPPADSKVFIDLNGSDPEQIDHIG